MLADELNYPLLSTLRHPACSDLVSNLFYPVAICDIFLSCHFFVSSLCYLCNKKIRKSTTVQSFALPQTIPSASHSQKFQDHHLRYILMIRAKSIFGKIFSNLISDKILFHNSIKDFRPHDHVCPHCNAKGNFSLHAYYHRDFISIKNGKRNICSVRIPRFKCESCNHTHAILPDILIPYGSYTLRFILTILLKYVNRSCSVEVFCAKWEISISTLYNWIHLFELHGTLWLGVLKQISKINSEHLSEVCNILDFPELFYKKFYFSFMQMRKTTDYRTPMNSS